MRDDADGVTLHGQCDGQVDRDTRLADAALARRDQQRARLRTRLGERHLAAFGMAVRGALAGSVAGVAVQHDAHGLALLVSHHGEIEGDPNDTRQRRHGSGDPVGDLVAQWATGDGERDLDLDHAIGIQLDVTDHPQVDDRAPQLGILHRSEGLDDLLVRRCRHG